MNTVTLHSALPEAAAGAPPPRRLHLVPAGTFRGNDGRGPYHLRDAQAVMKASMADGKLAIDENHAIDHAMKTGQPSPARGWIVSMHADADGIWGDVEWNESGVQLMSEKAYRGISPVLVVDEKTGDVRKVLRAALTNAPNLGDLTTLHSQQDTGMDPKALRAALGLPETADDATVLARITENATAVSRHSSEITAIALAAGVKAADANGLVTVLQTQRESAGDAAKLAGTVIELQTQLNAMKAETGRTRAVAAIDAAIAAGKPIVALRDHFISRHMADPTSVDKELAALPSLHAGGIGGQQMVLLNAETGTGDADLTAEDNDVIERMGLDPAKFKEHKAKMAAKKRGM